MEAIFFTPSSRLVADHLALEHLVSFLISCLPAPDAPEMQHLALSARFGVILRARALGVKEGGLK